MDPARKAEQRCTLPAQGIAQGDAVLEPRHRERLVLTVREGQSRAGRLGAIFFHGAMRAAHQCPFHFWCSGAETPQGAEEVTFWASFCLSYLAGASQIQLITSQHLRSGLDTAKCSMHVATCEHPLIHPQDSGQTGLAWVCILDEYRC